MYVLAPNQTVETFPYSIGALRRDNPNTSFPANPTEQTLAEWNVFPVIDKPAPDYNSATQNCNQINPTLKGSKWEMTWLVTPATPEQIAERTSAKESEVRQQRNQLLSACDWTQLADSPLDSDGKFAWALYRETLRMVPQQAGFPWNVVWPIEPG